MSIVDSVDEQIARLLGQNGGQNSETLAKQLNISAATVRRRLRKLIRSDLLRIVGVVDPASFGFPVIVMITFDIVHDKVELATKKLSKLPEIRFVSTITGRYDVIATARFRSTKHLSEFMTKELAQLEGLRDSETFLCLEVKKGLRTSL